MKPPSTPTRPPLGPEAIPRQDTPFDPFRFRVQPISMEERRKLIALELPSLDPKYLEDTKPPNGGLVAPDKPEATREPTGRHPALLAVGLIALAALAVATFWPLAKSPEPAVSPATAAEAMASNETAPKPASESDDQASDAEEQPMHSPVPTRFEAPTAVEPSVEQPRAREVSEEEVKGSQRVRAGTPQPRAAALLDSSSAATTRPVVAAPPNPVLPKSGSAASNEAPASRDETEDPTSVNGPRRIDQLLYQ